MLVLTRRAGQEIHISGPARIIIDRIKGHQVSIVIDAPAETRILRGELDAIAPGVSVLVETPAPAMVA